MGILSPTEQISVSFLARTGAIYLSRPGLKMIPAKYLLLSGTLLYISGEKTCSNALVFKYKHSVSGKMYDSAN